MNASVLETKLESSPASSSGLELPRHWVPERRRVALIMLVGGVGTLATSFASLPQPLLLVLGAAWCVAVMWFAGPRSSTLGFTLLSVLVKVTTLALVIVVFASSLHIGPRSGWDWVPLGFLNMGTGLWFLSLIRGRAR